MKFAILGAGAMGCLYGAKLAAVGQEVVFLANSQGNIEALNRGLTVHQFDDDGDRSFQIAAFKTGDYHETADVVLVFTKASDTKNAVAALKGVVSEKTILMSLQNGIGHEEILKAYADEDRIIIGTTNFPSDRIAYGEIRKGGDGISRMYTASGKRTTELEEIVGLFESAGLNPMIDPDIKSAIWSKAAFNAAINSVTAAVMIPQGYLSELEEGLELLHSVVDEVALVANAKGLQVSADEVKRTVDRLLEEHFEHCPSMLQDVLNQRTTEIEFINGAVVREARLLGLQVPTTEVLYKLIMVVQTTYSKRIHFKN